MAPPPLTDALVCPACRRPLIERSPDRLRCPHDRVDYPRDRGIWRLLTRRRATESDRFLADYRRLRRDEGWGARDDAYYRALPFRDLTGRHIDIWRIRAASYRLLRQRVLTRRRRIVDLGAGNGWLSWRLAEDDHSVAAVDLSDDDDDGLGAATAYPEIRFLRVQASFDRVPLADGAFDLAIFNGSLHYAADLRHTLAEARRLVRRGGHVVIMDSPVYYRARSGEHMVRERRREWRKRYGPNFAAFPAAGFLTRGRLRHLGKSLGLRWRLHPLPLGWRWRLAPLAALVFSLVPLRGDGRREPARFPLIVGRRLDR